MTPNKLPPLPERVELIKLFAPWFIASLGDLMDDYAKMKIEDVEDALRANGEYILPIIEALRQSQSSEYDKAADDLRAYGSAFMRDGKRIDPAEVYIHQSQSLPAGAVAGLVRKWRKDANGAAGYNYTAYEEGRIAEKRARADELEQALQADARENGEAVGDFNLLLKATDAASRKACAAEFDNVDDVIPFVWSEYDRLKATAQPAQASEAWQPIETAPKDGTHVWLYTASGQVEAYWCHGEWMQDAIFCTYDGTGGPAFDCKPTHWMPLPSEPVATSSQETASE